MAGIAPSRATNLPERVIFVCTANLIRSPFAAAAVRQLGLRPVWLPTEIPILSRGTHAHPGAPALPEAVRTAAEFGVDLRGHRSFPIQPDELVGAWVIGMTPQHLPAGGVTWRQDLLGAFLDVGEIPDPVGQPRGAYRTIYATILDALRTWADSPRP